MFKTHTARAAGLAAVLASIALLCMIDLRGNSTPPPKVIISASAKAKQEPNGTWRLDLVPTGDEFIVPLGLVATEKHKVTVKLTVDSTEIPSQTVADSQQPLLNLGIAKQYANKDIHVAIAFAKIVDQGDKSESASGASVTKTTPMPGPMKTGAPKEPKDAAKQASIPAIITQQFVIHIDTLDPSPLSARLLERTSTGITRIAVTFADRDLADESLVTTNFVMSATATRDGAKSETTAYPSTRPRFDRDTNTLYLEYDFLPPGSATLQMSNLKDFLGKTVVTAPPFTVNIPGGRQRGEYVQYPPFLARTPDKKEKGFDPHNIVTTRVARLYYYRDADRVAEIIRRDVQKLNQAGVDQAQRIASDARRDADEKTDERRQQEALAVQAAQKTRSIRAELNGASAQRRKDEQQKLVTDNEVKQLQLKDSELQKQLEELQKKLPAKNGEPAPQNGQSDLSKQIKGVQADIKKNSDLLTILTADSTRLNNLLTSADTGIAALRTDLSNQQAREIDFRNTVSKAEAAELRSKQAQFRREVAAGKSELDSYAPGQTDSFDPVQQVTVTVIGTGLIQLRGPLEGINKIRRMIHQIDSPVGQVKVGIHTVQVNGEHGNRMELVYERIQKHIAHSRFLTNDSLRLFRKAVSIVAGQCAKYAEQHPEAILIPPSAVECVGADNVHRLRYVYVFFGRDFLDELFRMDSELLKYDNKLISLNSMDSLSLAGAMYVTALADNPVREQILKTFEFLVMTELPIREYEYTRPLTRQLHADSHIDAIKRRYFRDYYDKQDFQEIVKRAARTYHFANLKSFFRAMPSHQGTLNNVQFATVRMAQALKAQLVAEMQWRNLVLQRSLLEKEKGEFESAAAAAAQDARKAAKEARTAAQEAETNFRTSLKNEIVHLKSKATTNAQTLAAKFETVGVALLNKAPTTKGIVDRNKTVLAPLMAPVPRTESPQDRKWQFGNATLQSIALISTKVRDLQKQKTLTAVETAELGDLQILHAELNSWAEAVIGSMYLRFLEPIISSNTGDAAVNQLTQIVITAFFDTLADTQKTDKVLAPEKVDFAIKMLQLDFDSTFARFSASLDSVDRRKLATSLKPYALSTYNTIKSSVVSESEKGLPRIRQDARLQKALQARAAKLATDKGNAYKKVFAKRILRMALNESEEKVVELQEAMRSHSSNVDNYLKRLAIALEDDLTAQFSEPAFQDVRRASRLWDVNLGQIETTTILTNNRTFAKVSPKATMEFDLPQRQIAIIEAFNGMKALATEYGQLMKDPTFLAGAKLLSGQQPVQGLTGPQSPISTIPGRVDGEPGRFGAALEALIPEPSVYKIETGTGFEIRPVIQPDGHSIVYNFNYMYTTDVREPVRADEKHIGRVKRHFVHTDVQTSSYELREVSRYTVALKLSRTSRGVPLLEDIPIVGIAFRPLASDESSLQQNIILASSVIYPTMFDLMGLRWSPYADEVGSTQLKQAKVTEQARLELLRGKLLDEARKIVDRHAGITEDDDDPPFSTRGTLMPSYGVPVADPATGPASQRERPGVPPAPQTRRGTNGFGSWSAPRGGGLFSAPVRPNPHLPRSASPYRPAATGSPGVRQNSLLKRVNPAIRPTTSHSFPTLPPNRRVGSASNRPGVVRLANYETDAPQPPSQPAAARHRPNH